MSTDVAMQQILEERARILARPQNHIDETPGEELVVFRLGDTCYGVPACSVLEVHPLTQHTSLPGTPDFILGLVNVRGRLLCAIDLRPLLGLPSAPPSSEAHLLILTTKAMDIGILADVVLDVRRSAGDLAPSLSSLAGHGTPWINGVDRHFTMLIDPALLAADPRLIINMSATV